MKVRQESNVDAQQQPFLHAWDTASRKSFAYFEMKKKVARDSLVALSQSPLTAWRSPVQLRHRYVDHDHYALRQQLGSISQAEVDEVNRVMGTMECKFQRCKKYQARLTGWNPLITSLYLAGGCGFGFYGLLVKRYNILWLPAAFLPVTIYSAISYYR